MPYLVCHSSTLITSESDCEFQTNLKTKKAQRWKIPSFLKKWQLGRGWKRSIQINPFDGNQSKRKAFHMFCQQWGGQSVVVLSFMQGQYHNWREKQCYCRAADHRIIVPWHFSATKTNTTINGYTTCVGLSANGGQPKPSSQHKKSKKPSNVLCLAYSWKKDCFTAAYNSLMHFLQICSD